MHSNRALSAGKKKKEAPFIQRVQGGNIATLFRLVALYNMYEHGIGGRGHCFTFCAGSGGGHRDKSTPVLKGWPAWRDRRRRFCITHHASDSMQS